MTGQVLTAIRSYAAQSNSLTRGRFKITRHQGSTHPNDLSSRTYREELYTARRFSNPNISTNSCSIPLNRMNEVMRSEDIYGEVRSRRSFVKPSKRRILALFNSRQTRFNNMFKETLGKIMQINESRK